MSAQSHEVFEPKNQNEKSKEDIAADLARLSLGSITLDDLDSRYSLTREGTLKLAVDETSFRAIQAIIDGDESDDARAVPNAANG